MTITWGGKGLFYLIVPHHSRSLREVRAVTKGRNMEEELMQKPWRCDAYWFSQPAFLQHPGPPSQEWYHLQWTGPSHIHHQTIWWGHFLNWDSNLFPHDSSLCQVDIKPAGTSCVTLCCQCCSQRPLFLDFGASFSWGFFYLFLCFWE